jgi:uncharacterized RDD family membrane protein YckC
VIDLVPLLPMALLILFSPLRQRLGDVISGTVVIADERPPAIETVDDAEVENSDTDSTRPS